MGELRRFARNCEFGTFPDDAMSDRLVCGQNEEVIQQKLLAESNLTLAKAQENAISMEAVKLNTKEMKGSASEQPVLSFKAQMSSDKPDKCYHCGWKHEAKTCLYKNAICHYCGKAGHITPVCRTKTVKAGAQPKPFPINEDHLRLNMLLWGLISRKNRKCSVWIE